MCPGRAVDEFTDDVGMPRVPSDFNTDVHQDLMQGDVLPLGGPPRNPTGRVEERASIVASAWPVASWYSAMIASRDSSAVAHMSALMSAPSSSQGSGTLEGRSNTSPK